MRSRSFLVLAAATALVAAAPAHAATPFTAGSGAAPGVAVGADGTGHVVWATEGGDENIGYCRVSAGAGSCNRTAVLDFGATAASTTGRPRVFTPAPNRVVVLGGCTQCPAGDTANYVVRWVSTNNGDSFGAPTVYGSGPQMGGSGTWLDDLGIYVNATGARVKAMAGVAGGDGVAYATGGLYAYDPEVVRAGANKLVAAVGDLDHIKYGVYTGGIGTLAAMNNAANWLVDRELVDVEPDVDTPSLSSGPNGVALTYRHAVTGDPRIGLRWFNGVTNAFGAPVTVQGDDPIDDDTGYVDHAQYAAGRLHVVWRSLHDGGRLRYRVSDPAATSFGAVGTLAAREGFVEPEIAAGPDGRGFVTWTPAAAGAIRVVALDPRPDSAFTPSAPGATTTSPGTATTPPVLPPPARRTGPAAPAAPSRYRGPARSSTASVAGGSVRFGVPGRCVNPGQRFVVTLKWNRKKRKGAKFVKVVRTDFYLGRRRVRIDRKAPFRHTMTVVASTRRGATITLRARAFIKVRRGKGPKKSIRATVKVCS